MIFKTIENRKRGMSSVVYSTVIMDKKPKLVIDEKKYKGKSSVLSIRVSDELIKKIDEIATETGRSRNEVLTLCLEFSVDNIIIGKGGDK